LAVILLLILVTFLFVWTGIGMYRDNRPLSWLMLGLGGLFGLLLLGGFFGFMGG